MIDENLERFLNLLPKQRLNPERETVESINRAIREKIFKACWHDWKKDKEYEAGLWRCQKCNELSMVTSNPLYLQSNLAAWEIVPKLEALGFDWYMQREKGKHFPYEFRIFEMEKDGFAPRFTKIGRGTTVAEAVCAATLDVITHMENEKEKQNDVNA